MYFSVCLWHIGNGSGIWGSTIGWSLDSGMFVGRCTIHIRRKLSDAGNVSFRRNLITEILESFSQWKVWLWRI